MTDLADLARSILRQPLTPEQQRDVDNLRKHRALDEAEGVLRRPYEFDSRLEWERCGICHGQGYGGDGMGNCAGCRGKGWILVERAPSCPTTSATR